MYHESQFYYPISQIFSHSLFKSIDNDNYVNDLKWVLAECKIIKSTEGFIIEEIVEKAYEYLSKNYRCEYVYINEIVNQLLLGYHSEYSATILKEIVSGSSIADVVIINGHSTAYEIKTELDSFSRLQSQVDSYIGIYDYVNVVTYKSAIEKIKGKIDPRVGIIILCEDLSLVTHRDATLLNRLFSPRKAVLTLRQSELINACKKHEVEIPTYGTSQLYEFCYNWFTTLNPTQSNMIFKECLKGRMLSKQQMNLALNSPRSLRGLFLGKKIPKPEIIKINKKIGILE